MKSKGHNTARLIGVPAMLGYLPASIAFGAMGIALHVPWPLILGLSLFAYSGALQSTVLGLSVTYNPGWLVILVALAVNLRHILYGPHLESARSDWRPWHRWLISAFLTDELYAVGLDPTLSLQDWSLIGIGLYLSWILGTGLGIFSARFIPPNWLVSLGLALPALFIGLLMPRLTHRAPWVAAVSAALLTAIGRLAHFPPEYLVVPILVGATSGYLLQERVSSR